MKDEYITKDEIEDRQLNEFMQAHEGSCGSLFLFKGIVRRDKTQKGFVKEIVYEAYEEMAETEMENIKRRTLGKFEVRDIFIRHRIGSIRVGEVSLLAAVLSAHRENGIRALDYLIDEIKQKVPIWKKEIFEDGSYRWR